MRRCDKDFFKRFFSLNNFFYLRFTISRVQFLLEGRSGAEGDVVQHLGDPSHLRLPGQGGEDGENRSVAGRGRLRHRPAGGAVDAARPPDDQGEARAGSLHDGV